MSCCPCCNTPVPPCILAEALELWDKLPVKYRGWWLVHAGGDAEKALRAYWLRVKMYGLKPYGEV